MLSSCSVLLAGELFPSLSRRFVFGAFPSVGVLRLCSFSYRLPLLVCPGLRWFLGAFGCVCFRVVCLCLSPGALVVGCFARAVGGSSVVCLSAFGRLGSSPPPASRPAWPACPPPLPPSPPSLLLACLSVPSLLWPAARPDMAAGCRRDVPQTQFSLLMDRIFNPTSLRPAGPPGRWRLGTCFCGCRRGKSVVFGGTPHSDF